MKLAVIGGGITGLAAAWEGVCQGAEVSVFEADCFGGKIRTTSEDGYIIEEGPDSFVAYRPWLLELIEELGINDQVIDTLGVRKVMIHSRGRMNPIPKGMTGVLPTKIMPFATTGILSIFDKLRACADLFMPRILPDRDVSIGSFLRRRLGAGVTEKFANPFIGGIYGSSVDELSLDAVLPSLRVNENEHRSLMLAALASGRKTRKVSKPSTGSVFRSLCGGLAQVIDELVSQLHERGVELINASVTSANLTEDGTELTINESGQISQQNFDAVVFAGGPESSSKLLAGSFPRAAERLASIPLASTSVVTMAYSQDAFSKPLDNHGWLEADSGAPSSGITISSAKFAGRCPDKMILVRAFVPDRVGEIAHAPTDELVAAVREYFETAVGAISGPERVWTSRWKSVMPKYVTGHLDVVSEVTEQLSSSPWRLPGSALNGVGLPDCVRDAREKTRELFTTPKE